MHWHNASDFFAMGGYALYVWGSFGACALAAVVEPWLAARRRRQIIDELRHEFEAERQDAPAGTAHRAAGVNP